MAWECHGNGLQTAGMTWDGLGMTLARVDVHMKHSQSKPVSSTKNNYSDLMSSVPELKISNVSGCRKLSSNANTCTSIPLTTHISTILIGLGGN